MIPILYLVNYNIFITSKLVLLLVDYTWFIVGGWILILNEAQIRLTGMAGKLLDCFFLSGTRCLQKRMLL